MVNELTGVWSDRRNYVVNEAVVAADVGDELVLLDIDTGVYFGLGAVGSSTWRLLTNGVSTEEIVASLLREYDVEEGRLRADLVKLFAELVERGLVHPADDRAS